jgi:hypothetical protein
MTPEQKSEAYLRLLSAAISGFCARMDCPDAKEVINAASEIADEAFDNFEETHKILTEPEYQ